MKDRKHLSKTGLYLVMVGLFALCSTNAFGATIYVPDQNATIQGAVNLAIAGDTVIVRDGTYLLTAALDFKGKAITVKSENGAGTCILDGQQQTRVVYFHTGEGNDSVLSGFTVRNGQADNGGGVYCDSSSPTITNCTIMANKAVNGGGIFCSASSPIIDNCTIIGNSASASGIGDQYSYGGGIFCSASSPIINNCTISGNSASAGSGWAGQAVSYGGGIYFDGGFPTITACTVSDNTAASGAGCCWGGSSSCGGGIFFSNSWPNIANCNIKNNATSAANVSWGGGIYFGTSTPSIVNSIINGNSATSGAGMFFDSSSSLSSVTNCTIVRNTANVDGGGLYCQNSSPIIVNSILWQNSPEEIIGSNPTVTYSDVTGGYTGTGNIDANPLFMDIEGQDFHLKSTSPCIDVGDNAAPELPTIDKDGNARIWNGIVDMGAYEYQICTTPNVPTPVSPSGTSSTATPTYTWNAVQNAAWYQVWVGNSSGSMLYYQLYSAAQAGCGSGADTCSVTPSTALPAGRAVWFVESWNNCGSGWSNGLWFDITGGLPPGPATLNSPTRTISTNQPTYSWNALANAEYYQLAVHDGTGWPIVQWYRNAEAHCEAGPGTCWVAPEKALASGDCTWFIQTYNSYGLGPWSDGMTFTTLGKASLVSPSGPISTNKPPYVWNAVANADYYLLVADDVTGKWPVNTWYSAAEAGCGSGTGNCSVTPNVSLTPDDCKWYIRTWSYYGYGPWSDASAFTIQ